MKKAIAGFVAVGAGVGLFLAARRLSRDMRAHVGQMTAQCKQMAAQCKGMMAGQNGSDEGAREREPEEIKKQTAAAPTA